MTPTHSFPPRWEKIRQLLRCLFDGDFDHVDFKDSLASLKTERGPAPSKRIECPDCGGEGWRRVRSFKAPCVRCGGKSGATSDNTAESLAVRWGRGWIEVDDYTETQVSTDQAPAAQPMRSVICDGCGGTGYSPRTQDRRCGVCEGTGRRDVPLNALSLTHGSERKREERTGDRRLDAATVRDRYDFVPLVEALKKLRRRDEVAYKALLIAFGVFPGIVLIEENVERAFRFLDSELPKELRVPRYAKELEARGEQQGKGRWANGEAQKRRDEKIRGALREGESPTIVAMRFGLSRSVVYAIRDKANGDEVAA